MSDVFGKRLGQYILLEQLGEGGMAKVYNALDSRAERNVAIKVILPSKRSSQVFLQQFEQEAKSLANLIHTNIVKVLNYGVEDGQPYLVMEFVPGGTLKEAMERPIAWQTAAAILAPIARALEYVHRQQIIHQDVKPSNILLDDDFRPMLSDFGIVKMLDSKNENNTPSAIGVGVGTPDYMPPEQGMGKDVDFRADIYSLGLVYYEMVTGKKPFAADTPMAAVIRHITDELPLPSSIDKKIPKFVESAMLRAIQKDPEDRYPSMGSFADVLELLALGKDAPAREVFKLSQKKRRKIQPKWLLTLLIPVVLGISFVAYWYWTGRETGQPTSSALQPTASDVVQRQATELATTSPPATEAVILQPTKPAAKFGEPAGSDQAPGVTLLGTPLDRPSSSQFREIARWGTGGINVVRWSPDGKLIALGTTSGIFLHDSGSKELVRFINTTYDVIEMTFNPDGSLILAGSLDGQVKAWQIENGELAQDFDDSGSSSAVTTISYSSNGRNLAIGYEDGYIYYYPADQTKPLMSIWQPSSVQALAISTDNRFLYVSNGENKIIIWDIAFKKVDSELTSSVPVNKFDMSQNGQFLLSAGNGNAAYLWDLMEGRVVSSFSNLGASVMDLEFSNNDELVVIGLSNGTIKVFAKPTSTDYSKAQNPLAIMEGFTDTTRSVAFSPDLGMVAAGNWKDGLKIWNTSTGKEVFILAGHMGAIDMNYFSPNGVWLVTAHEDGIVRVWEVNNAQEAYHFEAYLPRGLPFSPDNRFLTIIGKSEKKYDPDIIQIVELSSGKIVAELPDFQPGSLVQFTDDSKVLVTGDDHAANLWDVSTWEQLDAHGGMNAGCGQYFTSQNELLTVVYDTGVLFSYDEKVRELCSKKPEGATLVYYFESSHIVYYVLGDGRVWDWNFRSADVANIRFSAPYPFPDDIFLAADQDSGWYASVSNGKLFIQNMHPGKLHLTIETQDDYRYRVAFSPNQKMMALGSQYGSIHIWVMP